MYATTPVYLVGDMYEFGLRRPPIVADPTDQLFRITQPVERRLDLVSYIFYGTTRLWWVIADANYLEDPLVGVQTGTLLRIPTKSRLSEAGLLNS